MIELENYRTHYLYPSGLFASVEPTVVTTVLGSCVAVCLWDPILRIGGINHYMLPLWNGKGLASPKFGNIAIQKLIEKMEELGSSRRVIKAKIFGGGDVLHSDIKQFQIGVRNIDLANEILQKEHIPIISSSTGGELGRKILFFTDNGNVRQKFIQKQERNCLIPEKKQKD